MKDLKDILSEAFLIKKHQDKQNTTWVDLDLPSGIKWATCNIGARKPEEYGLLFQWGRIDGYKYDDKNHKFLSADDYVTTSSTEYKKEDVLKSEDDAAYQATKGEFRMPTIKEIKELIDYTYNKQTKLNGINGRKFISKKDDSKWIFIPAAGCFGGFYGSFNYDDSGGYIWSSSCISFSDAYYLYFSDYCYRSYNGHYNGYSVRGVLNK